MRVITPVLTSELKSHVRKRGVARSPAYAVSTYRQLVEHTARLAYANRDQLLFFRGQPRDYQSKAGGTTLYPAIYREDQLPAHELAYRFQQLDRAAVLLVKHFREAGIEGLGDLAWKRYIQWSILQHYEVVPTPLLDLTHSLRVACSFAQGGSNGGPCYVYVLGLPYLSHRISVDSEQDVVNVRLLSICPPAALRPYFQDAYMAGTPDITTAFETKTELDFRNRLVAKFEIPRGKKFWGDGFEVTPRSALLPPGDSIEDLCQQVRESMAKDFRPAVGEVKLAGELETTSLGRFMRDWAGLEEIVLSRARGLTGRNVSLREAIHALAKKGGVTRDEAGLLESLRQFRNVAVHRPEQVTAADLHAAIQQARSLRNAAALTM